jgi:hypothetical protein
MGNWGRRERILTQREERRGHREESEKKNPHPENRRVRHPQRKRLALLRRAGLKDQRYI